MSTQNAAAELLANLSRQVPGVIYQYRLFPDGRSCFPFASEGIREIYEVTPDEVREDAAAVLARLHPEDLASVFEGIQRSARELTTWDREYRVVLPAAGERWLHGTARPERLPDGSTLWHGFIRDVTVQRAATEQLLRLQAAIDNSITGIATAGLDGRVQYVNRAAQEFWGLADPAQAIGRLANEFWDDPDAARDAFARVLATGHDERVLRARQRSGEVRLVQARTSLIPGVDGAPLGVIASFLDITEAEANASALRLREQVLTTSLNAVVIADREGRMLYCNPAFKRLWGHGEDDDLHGRHALTFAEPSATSHLLEELSARGEWEGDLVAMRRDGTPFDVRVSANVVRGEDGRPQYLMASISDITEARRLEERLHQSQKMQTVGRLAGGIAHDFNNLLTVMKGYLGLVRAQLAPDSPLDNDLSEVDRAAGSAAMLTQRLLTFSRRQAITPQVLDLNELVRQLQSMLQRVIGEDVRLEVELEGSVESVRFDPNQLEQVLMNLAVNARDAMPGGGVLRIRTAPHVVGDAPSPRFPDAGPGRYVELMVEDTGHGMSPEVRANIFEPFFTTKASGVGTGLGLAMVYGAVTQNGGRIAVETAPDAGAAFHILLPAAGEKPTSRGSPGSADEPGGTEAVMLVEDEPAIRALAARVLARKGYLVTSFGTGAEALAALDAGAAAPDLLVTDVIMPGMHGRALADAVCDRYPGTRVLFVSGYTEDVIGPHGVLDAGVDFLAKPYSVTTLARRVREALDRPTDAGSG
ncbi:MAG: PAS domain S-box protein [Gemmatimonadaceae bacterium]|nr:PAS domain S-box protein [Gemmatimonadaceae bacterium]